MKERKERSNLRQRHSHKSKELQEEGRKGRTQLRMIDCLFNFCDIVVNWLIKNIIFYFLQVNISLKKYLVLHTYVRKDAALVSQHQVFSYDPS